MTPHFRHLRIGVAVSGGADSVFLLYALCEMKVAAAVLHVNHGLRGGESDSDESFVRALAERFGLPVQVLKAPPLTGNIEQEARRVRYEFFAAQIAAGSCDAVATGHTLDDQAETVLYRLLRGAGTAGLSGVRPATRDSIVRPLLSLRRADIRKWLADRNIHWQEDRSNQVQDFARNRIRLQFMPELMAAFNPQLPRILASTATWAQGEEDYWAAALDRLEGEYLLFRGETILISTGPFLLLPVAVQRRLLRRAVERFRGSLRGIGFAHIEAIRELMSNPEGSGRMQIPDLDVYRSFDWLRFAPPRLDSRLERDFDAELLIPGRTEVKDRGLTIEMELFSNTRVYNDDVQALDWERCAHAQSSAAFALRNWRPGDRYQPVGRTSAVKIKTLFQEYRVPLWERRTWPVIVQGGCIVWSRGFGVASDLAAGPESGKILTIREAAESKSLDAASMLLRRARGNQSRMAGAEVL